MFFKLLTPIFLFLFFINTAFSAVQEKVNLKVLRGKCFVKYAQATNWKKVQKLSKLDVGDLVKTLHGTKAEVRYRDGSILRIKANTKLRLEMGSVKMYVGNMWVRIAKRGSKFEVRTPTAVAGVRGTMFDIRQKRNKTKVSVYAGLVNVRCLANRKAHLLKTGYTAVVTNKDIASPNKFDVVKNIKNWVAPSEIKNDLYIKEIIKHGKKDKIDLKNKLKNLPENIIEKSGKKNTSNFNNEMENIFNRNSAQNKKIERGAISENNPNIRFKIAENNVENLPVKKTKKHILLKDNTSNFETRTFKRNKNTEEELSAFLRKKPDLEAKKRSSLLNKEEFDKQILAALEKKKRNTYNSKRNLRLVKDQKIEIATRTASLVNKSRNRNFNRESNIKSLENINKELNNARSAKAKLNLLKEHYKKDSYEEQKRAELARKKKEEIKKRLLEEKLKAQQEQRNQKERLKKDLKKDLEKERILSQRLKEEEAKRHELVLKRQKEEQMRKKEYEAQKRIEEERRNKEILARKKIEEERKLADLERKRVEEARKKRNDELERMRKERERIANIQIRLIDVRSKIKRLNDDVPSLRNNFQIAKNNLDSLKTSKSSKHSKIVKLKEQLSGMNQNLTNIASDKDMARVQYLQKLEKLKQAYEHMTKVKPDLQRRKQKIITLKKKYQVLKVKQRKIIAQKRIRASRIRRNASIRRSSGAIGGSTSSSSSDLGDGTGNTDETVASIAALLQEFQIQYSSMEDVLKNLQVTYNVMKESVQKLESRYSELAGNYTNLKKATDEVNSAIKGIEGEIENIDKSISAKQTSLTTFSQKLEYVRRELDELRNREKALIDLLKN